MTTGQALFSTIPATWLAEHEARGASTAEAWAFFDTLPAVDVHEMIGRWRGSGLPTAHPIDGLLEAYGWYGKAFTSPEDVQPLLFRHGQGNVVAFHPRRMPINLMVRHPGWLRHKAACRAFAAAAPLLRTRRPMARLRMMEHRGVASATMIYDHWPILDTFRRVDHDTLLGVMDLRDMAQPFFFVLRRHTG